MKKFMAVVGILASLGISSPVSAKDGWTKPRCQVRFEYPAADADPEWPIIRITLWNNDHTKRRVFARIDLKASTSPDGQGPPWGTRLSSVDVVRSVKKPALGSGRPRVIRVPMHNPLDVEGERWVRVRACFAIDRMTYKWSPYE
jgi:hypothetical protein